MALGNMHGRLEHVITAAGTRVAVRVCGAGPALVLCNGWSTSDFFWKHMVPVWEPHYTVVSWDYPGHGESEPTPAGSKLRLASLAELVAPVMDAAGVGHGTLLGYSMGCQVVLEAAARLRDRVDAAIPLLGSFEHMLSTASRPLVGMTAARVLEALPPGAPRAIHRVLCRVIRSKVGIPLGRMLGIVGPEAAVVDVLDYVEHFHRADPYSVIALAVAGERHSARGALGAIRAPVLIVTGEDDPLAPPRFSGELLHELLPSSRLVVLPAGTHTSLFEHHDEIALLVDDFLLDIGVRKSAPRK